MSRKKRKKNLERGARVELARLCKGHVYAHTKIHTRIKYMDVNFSRQVHPIPNLDG